MPVGLRHVGSHKINAGLFQPEEEVRIPGQPVELGNDQFGSDEPAQLECLFQLRSISLLSALDLDKLLDELPVAAIEEILDRLALRLKAEPGSPLARRRYPQIRYKFAFSHDALKMDYKRLSGNSFSRSSRTADNAVQPTSAVGMLA